MQRPHSSPHIRGRRLDKNRTAPLHFASSNYDVNLLYSQLRNRARTAAAEDSIDASAEPLYQEFPRWCPQSYRPGIPSMFIVSAGGRRSTNFNPRPISTIEKARTHRNKTSNHGEGQRTSRVATQPPPGLQFVHGGIVTGPLAAGSPTRPFTPSQVRRRQAVIEDELRIDYGMEPMNAWRMRF